MTDKDYRLGLVSVSFRSETPEKILETMAEAKLGVIEWGSDVHAPQSDIEKIKEIAKLQEKYKITCSSYGTYFRLGKNPLDELYDYINAAKILGTDVLRLWCYDKCRADMTECETENLIAECMKASEIAQEYGVTLCMECHKNTFTQNPDDAVYLMEKIGSENFRMYWQPFQWQTPEENLINARKIAPFTVNIHVFNWRGTQKFSLLDAVNEWSMYLNEFSGNENLLLEFMPNGTIDELFAEAQSLRQIAGGKI